MLLIYFLAALCGIQNLRSSTEDRIQAPLQWKHGVLTAGPLGEVLRVEFSVRTQYIKTLGDYKVDFKVEKYDGKFDLCFRVLT